MCVSFADIEIKFDEVVADPNARFNTSCSPDKTKLGVYIILGARD